MEYTIKTPYNRIAEEKELTKGELNALRHFWLVQQIGRRLADLREGNTYGQNLRVGGVKIGGLLTSDNDPVDYHNNAMSEKFLEENPYGLIPAYVLEQAAESIKKRKYLRNPDYDWRVDG